MVRVGGTVTGLPGLPRDMSGLHHEISCRRAAGSKSQAVSCLSHRLATTTGNSTCGSGSQQPEGRGGHTAGWVGVLLRNTAERLPGNRSQEEVIPFKGQAAREPQTYVACEYFRERMRL